LGKNRKVKSPKRREKNSCKTRRNKKKLQSRSEDILSGKLVVLMEDECHLLWGATLGYVWGKKNTKIEVAVSKQRERQPYDGAVACLTGVF
jgi:hypothetical protein